MLSRYNHSRTILLGAIALAAITIKVSAQPDYRTPKSVAGSGFEVYEATIPQIQDALTSGAVTSAELVDRYVARIDAYDQDGPRINSIRDLNLMARSIANELDRLRRKGQGGGPLFAIPIILTKGNLTEFANYLTVGMPAGYSSLGDFVFNPYDPRPDPRFPDGRPILSPGGSSSGPGASAAASF